MKNYLNAALPSDARQAYTDLMSSLESIQEEVREDERRQAIGQELSALETSVRRRYAEVPAIRDTVSTLVEQIAQQEGVEMVSTEGIAGLLSSTFSIFGRKKPANLPEQQEYNAQHKKAVAKFITELDKTYGNKAWLDKQTFVEGEVAASDIAKHFVVNNSLGKGAIYNIEVARKNVEGFCKAWAQVLKPVNDKVVAIERRCEQAVVGKPIGDEGALKVIRDAVEELNAIPSPIPKLPKMSMTGPGNTVPGLDKYGRVDLIVSPELGEFKTMPALSREDAAYAAKLVRELLLNSKWDPSWDLLWFPWLDFKDGGRLSPWIYDSDYALYEDFYDRFYYQSEPEGYVWALYYWMNQYKLAVAIVKYIDRSIK